MASGILFLNCVKWGRRRARALDFLPAAVLVCSKRQASDPSAAGDESCCWDQWGWLVGRFFASRLILNFWMNHSEPRYNDRPATHFKKKLSLYEIDLK